MDATGLLRPSLRKLHRLGFDSYKAYQKSEHWQTIRRLYRVAALPQNCPCGKPGTQLHHQHYELLGEEWRDLTCLQPLCSHCHRYLHNLTKRPANGVLTKRGRPRKAIRN